MEAKESESALHCRLLNERDEKMRQQGRKEVVEWIDKNVCYPYPVGSSGFIKWHKQRKKWGITEV